MGPRSEADERFPGHRYPQRIPEPVGRSRGGPPPWSELAPHRLRGLSLDLVAARVAARSPHGVDAPTVERSVDLDAAPRPAPRRAAVLVALFEERGECHVVLTRRAATLRSHRGEVAFPGGRGEPGESDVETALREAREEVGDDVGAARPIGRLGAIVSFAAGAVIEPIVARLEAPPRLVAQPHEVERAFSVALADLAAEGTFREERWQLRASSDEDASIYFFRVPGDLVWGATASVLVELVSVATGLEERR